MASTQSGSVLERTVLKSGPLFLVADRGGDIKALNAEGHGLYFQDMRHLSLFELDVAGTRLTLLAASVELNSMSELQFANDTLLDQRGEVAAEPRTLSVRRRRFLHGSLEERLDLFNYNPHPLRLTVRFTCGSDFRDMFSVRGFEVEDAGTRGVIEPIVVLPDGVVFAYRGRERGMRRLTRIAFDPPPEHIEIVNPRLKELVRRDHHQPHVDQRDEGLLMPPMAAAAFQVELPPMAGRSIAITATPRVEFGAPPDSSGNGATPAPSVTADGLDATVSALHDAYAQWCADSTSIETDHQRLDAVFHRALLDLHLLVEHFEDDLVPTAGIPWFAVPFGRDSLITSMQTLLARPAIARGTLRFLARHQGTQINKTRGEVPGKILHEVRPGELGDIVESIYYGSSDSTPLFLMALGEYVSWSGDLALARELLPKAEAALAWMDHPDADPDGDGFIEMNRYPPEGLGNQGWKDSPDSVTHTSGELASAPIALAEVQAYRFGAHRHMAQLYDRLGQPEQAAAQRAAAERTRSRFIERLTMCDQDGRFWAMGLDRHKQRVETITSNPGHALWVGLLDTSDAEVMVRRLLADDMLSGWGVRTLSSRARHYNPMSYHNGPVWPHDTAIIALGMKRAGFDAAAATVASQVLEAGLRFPGSRLPELWCGFPRDRRHDSAPAQYPVGCSPQAWAAGSAFMLLQALLGLEVDAFAGEVRLRPTLPRWLDLVRLRRLRVGQTQIDLDVRRVDERLRVDVLDDGGLRIDAAT